MPDLREVFEMTIKQMGEPDLDSWREQESRQRKANRNKKLGAIAVAAVLVVAGVVFGVSTLGNDEVQPGGARRSPPTERSRHYPSSTWALARQPRSRRPLVHLISTSRSTGRWLPMSTSMRTGMIRCS